jgi:sigma-70-like protein
MQDRTVVADVIAGDAEGFGAAYDQYAASLYAYCRSMLPEGEAAEAVLEVFLIAAAKLDGLGDPERLGAWLQAVARNECLRRLGPSGAGAGAAGGEFAAATPPDGLRGKVLAACTDNTPAGRARRASAAHRAGAFDQAGFPRAIGPSGPRWWRRLQRHPGLASLAGLLMPLLVAAAVAAMLAAGGGPHRAAAAAVRSGPEASAPVSSAVPGPTHPTVPARQVTAPANVTPSAAVSVSASVPAAASSPAVPTGRGTAPSPTSASPSPSPSPSSPPALGYLLVAPAQLSLTSKAGTPVSGSFVLTAVNGPVPRYTVQVAGSAGKVSVSPGGGSLPASGIVTVTVTVTSKVALTTHVTVAPNGVSVTVVYTPKPKPAPSPTPTSKGKGG